MVHVPFPGSPQKEKSLGMRLGGWYMSHSQALPSKKEKSLGMRLGNGLVHSGKAYEQS